MPVLVPSLTFSTSPVLTGRYLVSTGMSVLGQYRNVSTWSVRMPVLVKRYHPRHMTVLVPTLAASSAPVVASTGAVLCLL
ncbi:unnamed protein product [Macrosiphum euphorbiae]|uniref:Uncharacterized protein n=1 Tax=Macrosiphum euphorbiae TaxID=13131 RepID=A0AAV0XRI0_9HEMI|nr:unnamed protein product [Macrosiphum euphorbiae]CAI6371204.1 unnamed protein product [Macrosiphum euphorbiae]